VRILLGINGLLLTAVFAAHAQAPPVAGGARPGPAVRTGGFIPGQQRAAGDPAQIERGGKIYSVSCRACHGADLRGGDMGGPNLLRSQLSLSDKDGELIVPVIQGSLQASGMPAIKMSPEDAMAVAAYVRSVLATIGSQGRPPGTGLAPESVVVGNAARGEAYFQSKCAGCHSPTGDLRGIATKYADPKVLQNTWVAGGGRPGRGGSASGSDARRARSASVTTADGRKVEGRVVRIDDFYVTLQLSDGSQRTFTREGDVPKVEVRDPLKAHRDLLSVHTDDDMHDVTAWLVTLK
jgi:cytochrome c oxidase cbb3-type subunit III